MLTNKKTKLNLAIVLMAAVVVLAMVFPSPAVAKKGGGGGKPGGGGGGPVDTGTIYYASGGPWSMNPDGSGKTPLPVGGVPSMTRHPDGGDRWLLQVNEMDGFYPVATSPPEYWWQISGLDDLEAVGFAGDPNANLAWGTIIYYIEIDGEGDPCNPDTDPDTFSWYANSSLLWGGDTSAVRGVGITGAEQLLELPPIDGSTGSLRIKFESTTGHKTGDWWGVYANKTQRCELFAVREDGQIEVQLTEDPDVQPFNRPEAHWATDYGVVDGKVSYRALRWEGEVVVEQGLFIVEIAWIDGMPSAINPVDGNPTSVPVQPTLLPVSGSYGYDWSPEGTWIVYTATGPEIWVADAYAGGSGEWLCDGYGPRWSPVLEDDSTLIAFAIGSWGNTQIRTINPNGASPPTPVVAMGKNRTIKGDSIYWSPMGTHLVYTRIQSNNNSYNVYRVGADGSDPTNLTNDLKENAFSIGWRD
jgi:hypothetical protein